MVFDIEETGMGTFPAQLTLTQYFAAHHGVVAVCQLRELGVSLHEASSFVGRMSSATSTSSCDPTESASPVPRGHGSTEHQS